MIERKTFLGACVAVGVASITPSAATAKGTFPSLTEALADGERHTVKYVYSITGLDFVTVSGQPVRWRVEEQPPGDAIALTSVYAMTADINQYALHAGDWRLRREMGKQTLDVKRPGGFGVWAGSPHYIILI